MDSSIFEHNAINEDSDHQKNVIREKTTRNQQIYNKTPRQVIERQQTNSWNQQQDYNLIKSVCIHGKQSWKKITQYYNSITPQRYRRTENQCWQRWTRVLSIKSHFSDWNQEEIDSLRRAIQENTINSYDVFITVIPTKTKSQIHRMVRSIFVEMVCNEVLQEQAQNNSNL